MAQIYTKNGDLVRENQLILQLEVMKLFYDISAGIDGRINLLVSTGEFVAEGHELGTITEV